MGKQTNAFVKDMEYLVKLLHKEWERSGKKAAEILVRQEEVPGMEKCLAGAIHEKQKQLENKELTFKESMQLSKCNFILLRLVKRIRKAEEKAKKKGTALVFRVELDKEEYKLYQGILHVREAEHGEKV